MAGRRQSGRRRPQAMPVLMQHDRLATSHIVPEAHDLKFRTSVLVLERQDGPAGVAGAAGAPGLVVPAAARGDRPPLDTENGEPDGL
jgi:hypothetical protein